jgi:hypothetical protein
MLIFLLDYFQECAAKVFNAVFMTMAIKPSVESCGNAFGGIFSVTKIHIEKVVTKGATF